MSDEHKEVPKIDIAKAVEDSKRKAKENLEKEVVLYGEKIKQTEDLLVKIAEGKTIIKEKIDLIRAVGDIVSTNCRRVNPDYEYENDPAYLKLRGRLEWINTWEKTSDLQGKLMELEEREKIMTGAVAAQKKEVIESQKKLDQIAERENVGA